MTPKSDLSLLSPRGDVGTPKPLGAMLCSSWRCGLFCWTFGYHHLFSSDDSSQHGQSSPAELSNQRIWFDDASMSVEQDVSAVQDAQQLQKTRPESVAYCGVVSSNVRLVLDPRKSVWLWTDRRSTFFSILH